MKFLPVILGMILLAGCATFHSQPIIPEKTASTFEARSLTNDNLHAFLETNRVTSEWPRRSWDLNTLVLVAFYYQPTLAEAHAQWAAAQAGEITAGERPNPSVTVTPVTFDIPLETAGKRGKRLAEANALAEAARWDFISAAWQARSRVRTAFLNYYAAEQSEHLLAQQEFAQSNVVRLLQGQFSAGAISDYDVNSARVTLETTQLSLQDAAGQLNQARAELAGALGLPLQALDGVKFSFASLDQFPRDLTRPEVRRQALFNRADVRGALAQYAASQSDLQLEIANQYPDIHIGPGYAYNSGSAGDNQWELGLTVTLPLLNHNEGPVAEAMAKRTQAAAHFLTVQAAALSEIDSAYAGYHAALAESATTKSMLADLTTQLKSVRAQAQLGEVDALALADAETAYCTGAQNQLDARVKAQQALGALEDAVQSPLTLSTNTLNQVQKNFSQAEK
jgi:outer membrane protein TolC